MLVTHLGQLWSRRQCLLLMHADERGKIFRTSRHLDQVYGKKLAGSSLWQAILDDGGGTDKITLMDFANQVSLRRRARVEHLLFGGPRPKVVDLIEAFPLEDKNNTKSFYFVHIQFQKDENGKEKPEADEHIVKWMRSEP